MCNKRNSLWLLLLLLVPLVVFGQEEELIINDLYPPSDGNYLDDVIFADTAGAGQTAWAEGRRVYVLDRDGIYPCRVQINLVTGRNLKIKAGGTGTNNPQIWMYDAVGSTRPPGNLVQANGVNCEIIVKDVDISGYQEDTWGEVDGIQGGLLRAGSGAIGCRILAENCIIKSTSGNHIRTDGGPQIVSIVNCIFADMGTCVTSNLGGGKSVDLRANAVDTIIYLNSTFINQHDRFLRHYNSTGEIHNMFVNNNTFINSLSYHGMFSLGDVNSDGSGKLEMKNNLFLDVDALGLDSALVRQAEYDNSGEVDEFGAPRLVWIIARPNTGAQWDIAENYYSLSDSGAYMYNALPSTGGGLGPILHQKESPACTWGINAQIASLGGDTINNFRKIGVQMVNTPSLMTNFIRFIMLSEQPPYNGGGKGKCGNLDPNWLAGYIADGIWAYDYDRRSIWYYRDSLDCNFYSDLAISGIGAPTGTRLGPLPVGTAMAMAKDWNLVSVARLQLDYTGSVVFPGMQGSAYAYNTVTGGYTSAPTLANGDGYWVNYAAATAITNVGVATHVPLTVTASNPGWVLVGSRAWAIPVASLQLSAGVINGSAYAYNPATGGYVATPTINPGQAVWVNVSAACNITIP